MVDHRPRLQGLFELCGQVAGLEVAAYHHDGGRSGHGEQGDKEGYSERSARLVTDFQLAARLCERRPASRKDWVTTLSPTETGRACIIPPDSPKTRSSTCARWYMQMRRTATSIRGSRPSVFTSQWS